MSKHNKASINTQMTTRFGLMPVASTQWRAQLHTFWSPFWHANVKTTTNHTFGQQSFDGKRIHLPSIELRSIKRFRFDDSLAAHMTHLPRILSSSLIDPCFLFKCYERLLQRFFRNFEGEMENDFVHKAHRNLCPDNNIYSFLAKSF